MNTGLDDDAFDLLLDSVESEGDVSLRMAGEEHALPVAVPADWRGVLQGRETPASFIERTWAPISLLLPRTVTLLGKKTSAIALLATASRPLSLLYLFGLDKEFYANRGFAPGQEFEKMVGGHALDQRLQTFYAVHDGWTDFFSLDAGLLPTFEWRFDQSPDAPFLEIYRNGSNSLRYDLSTNPATLVSLQPDDSVVAFVPDLWKWLDQEYVATLEELDDADVAK